MSLINHLISQGYLKSLEIIRAFKKIKRIDFVRDEDKDKAGIDSPLSINYGQTISQPATVAFMVELLNPKIGDKILDIGSGSGWTTALLAEIVGGSGKVFGVERICPLKEFAKKNISKYNFIKTGIVQIFCSDGYKGLVAHSPFDKILVSAASEIVPRELINQLKIGGRLVIPIGRQYESQTIYAIDKISDLEYNEKKYPGFVFVPLVKNGE